MLLINFKETNDKYIVVSFLKKFSKIASRSTRKLFKDWNSNTEKFIEQNLLSLFYL